MPNPTYTGPATLTSGKHSLPLDATLDEHPADHMKLGSWECEADVEIDHHSAVHEIWMDGKPATLTLGDGRSGEVLIADILLRPDHLSLLLRGNGPAPL